MSERLTTPHRWRLLATGLAVGGLAALLVFTNTDIPALLQILKDDIDYPLAGAALLVYALFFVGKAVRWRYLLSPLIALPVPRLTTYVLVGYAGNVLLPFQAGEIARGYLLSKHHPVKAAAALSGIAIEKALDFLALLVLLVWALWTVSAPSPLAESVLVSLAVSLSLLGLLLLALLMRPEATGAAIDRALGYGPERLATWLGPPVHDALGGLTALRQGSLLWRLVLTSLITWGIMLAALSLTLQAVQLEVPLAIAVVVMVLAAVGLALPTSPGFFGTLQAAFVLGMVPFGVAQEAAVAASLLYQALTTVPPLLAGALCLVWLRSSPAGS